MDPTRRTALVAGILYLVTFAASIPAVFLLGPMLDDPRYVIGTGPDMQIGLACVLDMVNALAAIGTAVAIFSVAKRVHEGFALGFVTTRLLEAAIIAIGVVGLLGLLSLRQEGVAAVDTGGRGGRRADGRRRPRLDVRARAVPHAGAQRSSPGNIS